MARAPSTPVAISAGVRRCATDSCVAYRLNAAMPISANAICASACIVVLTVTAAAASAIRVPRCARWRTISTGPPICPAGSRLFTDSPTQRARSALPSSAPGWPGRNITEIATASIASGTTWNAATSARPQPAARNVDATAPTPCQASSAMKSAVPRDSRMRPARVMTRSCVASPVA